MRNTMENATQTGGTTTLLPTTGAINSDQKLADKELADQKLADKESSKTTDETADQTADQTTEKPSIYDKYISDQMTAKNAYIATAVAATGLAIYMYSSPILAGLSIAGSSLTQVASLMTGFALANPIVMGAIVLTTLTLAIGGFMYYKGDAANKDASEMPIVTVEADETSSDSIKPTLSRKGSEASLKPLDEEVVANDEGNISRKGSEACLTSLDEEANQDLGNASP